MSTGSAFLFGCLGGLIAFIVIMLLPELRLTWETKNFDALASPSLIAVVVIGSLALLQILVGGIAAVWMEDADTPRQAITYGIAGEALFSGALRVATKADTGDGTKEKKAT